MDFDMSLRKTMLYVSGRSTCACFNVPGGGLANVSRSDFNFVMLPMTYWRSALTMMMSAATKDARDVRQKMAVKKRIVR